MTPNNAVITGATQGLGRALAEALARRGWQLVIAARTAADVERVARELGARGVVADIADADGRAAIARAAAELETIDLVVNNAGTLGATPLPPLLDYPLGTLRQVLNINVVAQLAVLQELREYLSPQPTIVNISSDAGAAAYSGWGGYGASKAALDHISRVLAVENPDWRVLSVDPGDMRTAMHQAAFPGEDIGDRPEPEASVPALLELIVGEFDSGRYVARDLQGAA